MPLHLFFAQAKGTLLGMFDMFSGGGLSKLSVFSLGIMPYISSSIIIELLAMVVPTLERLKKEGEAGRRKISRLYPLWNHLIECYPEFWDSCWA